MCRCKGCDKEIEVKWYSPAGTKLSLLEDLCNTCLAWAEVAKANGPLPTPSARRRPTPPFLEMDYGESD